MTLTDVILKITSKKHKDTYSVIAFIYPVETDKTKLQLFEVRVRIVKLNVSVE